MTPAFGSGAILLSETQAAALGTGETAAFIAVVALCGLVTYLVLRKSRYAAHAARAVNDELERSEERYKLAVQGTNIGLWDWDLERDEVYWSPRMCEILGVPSDNYTPDFNSFIRRIHPEDSERVRNAVLGHIECGTPYDEEYRYEQKDGSITWIHARGQAIWDSSGKARRMAGSIDDITDRKLIESTLAQSERRLQMAMDAARCGIWDWPDITKSENWWDERAYRLLGYEPNEMPIDFQFIKEILHPNDRERVLQATAEALDGAPTSPIEYRLRAKDGTYRWFLASGITTRDSSGQVTRMTGIIMDIHERMTMHEELASTNEALRLRTEELEQLIYMVSHDLKSPLSTILGFARLMRDRLANKKPVDVAETLDVMIGAGNRMTRFIDDTLNFSKLDSAQPKREVVSLRHVLEIALDNLQLQVRDARCVVEIPDELPDLMSDATRILQIFQNLIGNALKYGCDQAANRIVIGSVTTETESRFYVQDFGPGIERDEQARVFAMFHRLDSEKDGTGVGLAIVKKAAESLGGRVWLDSEPGEGCRFNVAFPRELLAAAAG